MAADVEHQVAGANEAGVMPVECSAPLPIVVALAQPPANTNWSAPLTTTLEQVTYFQPAHPERLAPGLMPLWIWMDDPSYYGFPEFVETGWVKAAQDCGGMEVTAQSRSFSPDPDDEARLMLFLAHWMDYPPAGSRAGPRRVRRVRHGATAAARGGRRSTDDRHAASGVSVRLACSRAAQVAEA